MHKWIAEMIGSFALVFFGTGAIIINHETGGVVSHAGIAITFGLIVMVMIYTLGSISGAHMNPAVTIAFAIARRFPIREVFPYVISQLIGALIASFTLKVLFPHNLTLGATLPAGSITQAAILEFLLSFFLMFVIMNAAKGGKEEGMFAGIAIGSTVLIAALVAGPITGASMNPARSIAPAIASGHFQHLWMYIVAPIAGTAFAVPVYNLLHRKTKPNENSTF